MTYAHYFQLINNVHYAKAEVTLWWLNDFGNIVQVYVDIFAVGILLLGGALAGYGKTFRLRVHKFLPESWSCVVLLFSLLYLS